MNNEIPKLQGYRRANGRAGIRNHILVIPTVVCANIVVETLIRQFGTSIVSVTHPYGCTFDPVSNQEFTDTIVGMATNPNVGAVLIIGLGCETVNIDEVYDRVKANQQLVEKINIQANNGTIKTADKAVKIIEEFKRVLAAQEKETIQLSELIFGMECGSSDSYSGLSSNPALGKMADRIVGLGGTVILTELTEFVGAEDLLYAQCADETIAAELKDYLGSTEKNLARVGNSELLDIAPGNIAGGLTTLEEKSLGCIKKGGSTPIRQIVTYSEIPSEHGLIVMDAPGHDIESMIAMAAGGSQLIFFSTGRGSPTGNPIVPVIKVSSNNRIFESMPDNIDISAGSIITGDENLDEVAGRIFDLTLDVINGDETKSELNHSKEFAIRRCGVDVCIL